MREYINRLVSCGYSPDRAYLTCQSFLKEYSINDLEQYISSIEEDSFNVDRIQPKPNRETS